MTVKLRLCHETTYLYEEPVFLGPHSLRLKPAYHSRVPTSNYRLSIDPRPTALHWQQDPVANPIARAIFEGAVKRLQVIVEFDATLIPINPFDFFIEPGAAQWPFEYPTWCKELTAYFQNDPPSAEMSNWIAELPDRHEYIVSYLVDLNRTVYQRVAYEQRDEHGVQSPQETLNRGIGSCRDSAWLFVQLLRQLGLMARFVSGYLIQPEDEASQTQELSSQSALTGRGQSMSQSQSAMGQSQSAMGQSQSGVKLSDSVDPPTYTGSLHAWTEAYLPGAGWIGMDPTSGMMAGEGHIPLAATPSWQQAAPVDGTHGQSQVELHHQLTLERL